MNLTKPNLIFIGLPGCGKTVVSRLVADRLGMPWHDYDTEIEHAEGMTIPEIFALKGEPAFRDVETAAVTRLSQMKGIVISTGGGVVLRIENMQLLKQSGTVIYLKRALENILSTLPADGRPLLKSPTDLIELHRVRAPLYECYCDFAIDNDGNMEQTVEAVLEAINGTN